MKTMKIHRLQLGKKKEPKPKLFGPDISGWGGSLPREGVGAQKFGMSFETQGKKQLFGGISWDFVGMSPGHPKSLRKKKFVFNSRRLLIVFIFQDHGKGGLSLRG